MILHLEFLVFHNVTVAAIADSKSARCIQVMMLTPRFRGVAVTKEMRGTRKS
jgi:hypothetical protein